MAKMYPSKVIDFHASQGERQVYESLKKLSNEYTVFYSFRWLGTSAQRRSEGEADFLVLHPKKGILSIEVKAGGIAYRDGNWIQINRKDGREKIIDPLGQAAESQHRIINLLRGKFGMKYGKMVVGRAAWFTSVIINSQLTLPSEAHKSIVFDESALDFPQGALDRAFKYWKDNMGWHQALNVAEFKEIVKFLMPTFSLAETISSYAREEAASYVQLTERQAAILHFLKEQPMAAIHGPAGTGKSLLAVEKVKLLAAEGKKVLYLCFNEFLLEHLRICDYDKEHITFHNLRTLAEEIMHDNSLALNEIIPFFEEYFADSYDDDNWQYPNVVVDEGQDFSDSVMEHLAYLAELNDGIFYVFYDRNQYIMQQRKPEWIDKNAECRLVLYKNCRNTAEIAAMAGEMISLKNKDYINGIHGLKPKLEYYEDADGLEKLVEGFMKTMKQQGIGIDDYVILTVGSVKNSLLQENSLTGVALSENKENGKIWFTSVRKFKGLEAKAVLLIDARKSRMDDPVTKRVLYVGCSRASSYLEIAINDDLAL